MFMFIMELKAETGETRKVWKLLEKLLTLVVGGDRTLEALTWRMESSADQIPDSCVFCTAAASFEFLKENGGQKWQ